MMSSAVMEQGVELLAESRARLVEREQAAIDLAEARRSAPISTR